MYAVSKEHKGNKIFAKTRRGIPQKFDSLESNPRDNTNGVRKDFNGFHSSDGFGGSSNPRPVFHMNGRKTQQQRSQTESSISAQHLEIVKYIHENWKCVKKDLDSNRQSISGEYKSSNTKVPQIRYYKLEKTSHLPKFEPFDLESFWGQRLFQNITQST